MAQKVEILLHRSYIGGCIEAVAAAHILIPTSSNPHADRLYRTGHPQGGYGDKRSSE
jgi:hypothetical protein